jgi:hypothetical protein
LKLRPRKGKSLPRRMIKPSIYIRGFGDGTYGVLWGFFQCQWVCECVPFVEYAMSNFTVMLPVWLLAVNWLGIVRLWCALMFVMTGILSNGNGQYCVTLRWMRADIMCQFLHTCSVYGFLNGYLI